MKKRLIAALLTLVLLFSGIPVPAFAAEDATTTLTVDGAYAMPGSTVTVNVDIAGNPGILGATLTASWDDGLTLVDSTNGVAFSELTFQAPSRYTSGCNFVWYGSTISEAIDGTVLTLTFEVSETAEDAEVYAVEITYDSRDILDENYNEVELSVINGSVQIITYTPGDVTGDDRINPLDLIKLCQYISDGCVTNPDGFNITINESAADVNDDGRMNPLDLIFISRYISDGCITDPNGYNIVLKPSTPKCNHTMQVTEAKNATCTENGNIAYWYCSACEKYFFEETAKTEITLKDTVIVASHNLTAVEAKSPSYTEEGNIAYWYCDVCEKYYGDATAATEITQEDTVIPKLQETEYLIEYDVAGIHSYLKNVYIENPNPTSYTSSETIILNDLSAEGYDFNGWYDAPQSASTYNRVSEIAKGSTGNRKLYAHWTEKTWNITYNVYQTPIKPIGNEYKSYKVSEGLTSGLPNPEIYNYVFLGWYTEDGEEVTSVPAGTAEHLTLNAYWTSKRNLAKAKTSLDKPIVLEDTEEGVIYFAYEIGTIENVPVSDAIWSIKAVSGLSQQVSETVTKTVSNTAENGISYIVSKSTVDSDTWTLSEDWNESVQVNEEWAIENGYEEEDINTIAKTESDTYSLTSTTGGASSTTHTDGTTTVNYNSKNTEKTTATELEVNAKLGYKAEATASGFGVSATAGYSAEIGASAGRTEKDTTNSHTGTDTTIIDTTVSGSSSNWNKTDFSSNTKAASESSTVSTALSEVISETKGYGSSYIKGGGESTTQGTTSTESDSVSTSSTVTYFTSEVTTTTKTYSTDGKSEGSYRLVMAGKLHVFAVVGYDIATGSYFTYTHSVLDDEVEEFLDYSSDGSFSDNEYGVLPFEVPYEVHEYIIEKTASTKGLGFKTNSTLGTAVVNNYSGTDVDVQIPTYYAVDETYYKVVGIEPAAFAGKNIRSIILGEHIKEIPDGAFKNCTALEQISGWFTKIGAEAFSGCTALEGFTVSAAVSEIGANAFLDVPSITVNVLNTDNALKYEKQSAPELTEEMLSENAAETTQTLIDSVLSSGAKSIAMDISNVIKKDGLTLEVPAMTYFELNGGKNKFTEMELNSAATTTVLKDITISNTRKIPLEISSSTLELSVVSVESAGYAMLLSATAPTITLRRDNFLTAANGKAVVWNSPTLNSVNVNGATGYLDVSGNVYTYGSITGQEYLDVTNGEIIPLNTTDEFSQYVQGSFNVTFDPNDGSVDETTRVVFCGTQIGVLPTPTREGYNFEGWYTEEGTQVTADTVLSTVNSITLTAKWSAMAYKVDWNTGSGYSITVERTSSPYANAATGALSSGAEIYYGDVLNTTYAASEGYTLTSQGKTSITVTDNVTVSDIYASAKVNEYTVSWNAGSGYAIVVSRTSSPLKGASTGSLSNGTTVYYGDILSVTYTASTGYSISSKGNTSVTVTGDVTSSDIYASATVNSYTYNIVYKSSNGTSLGSSTAKYNYGTTNTITAPGISGYDTPGSQSVKWDSTTPKTITFVYVPSAVSNSTQTGTAVNSPLITYSANVEYRNRTATSVQLQLSVTSTIRAGGYVVYGQCFDATANAVSTGRVTICGAGAWNSATSSARSATGTSGWITIPLNTTNATTVTMDMYYYQINYNGTDKTASGDASGINTSWSVNIPAY